MRDVAGMNHEGRLGLYGLDPLDRLFQRTLGVGVGGLVKAYMAVTDLQERQPLGVRRQRLVDQAERVRHPAADGPQHSRTHPGHAFQHLAAADAVIVVCHRRLP